MGKNTSRKKYQKRLRLGEECPQYITKKRFDTKNKTSMTASLRLGRLFFPDSSDEQYSFHSTKMIQIGQTSCLIFLVRLIKRNVTSGDPEQRQHLSYHPLSPDMCLVGILEWARPEDLFGHPGLFHRSQQHVCATEALGFLQEIFGDHSKNNCTVIYDLVAN